MDDDRCKLLVNLITRRLTNEMTFALHPPRILTDDPPALQEDGILDRLGDEKWWIKCSDGVEESLTFRELVVFTYNFLRMRHEIEERMRGRDLEESFALAVNDYKFIIDSKEMTDDGMVLLLLSQMQIVGLSVEHQGEGTFRIAAY